MDQEELQKLRGEMQDEFAIEDDYIEVSDGHKIWYQLWGNKEAKTPYINFHGGPGSHTKQKHKAIFDPKRHLVIFFDQRGCGRSQYRELLTGNTSQDLISDAGAIIDKLGYDKVKAFGGSWGSTLAMLFTITHPNIVEKLVITGTFPADKQALKHWDDSTMSLAYPEIWQKLLEATPREHHDKPTQYHFGVIDKGGEAARRSCAVLQNYEGNIMELDDNFDFIDIDNIPDDFDQTSYTIFAHYENNNAFMEDGYIIKNLKKYKGETSIVHGRFDFVCPYRDAIRVKGASHNARLYTTIAGHKPNHETIAVLRSLL